MTLAISDGGPAPDVPYATIAEAIRDAVARRPDGQFIHMKRDGSRASVSYEATLGRARQIAAALGAGGIAPGDGLVLNLRDSEDFVPALWGALFAGAMVVPLVQNVSRRAGAERRREIFGFVCGAVPRPVVLTDDAERGEIGENARLLRLGDLTIGGEPVDADIGAVAGPRIAILTSGATGRNKLVGMPESAVLARWWPRVPDARDEAAFLSWSPFDHVMGLGLAAPNLARKIHLDAERFAADPLSWLDALSETGATHATMTNFGLSLVVEAVRANPDRQWNLGVVRKVGIGAEQVSPALCSAFLDALTPFGLRDDALILGYGLTECGPVVGGGAVFSPASVQAGGSVSLDRPTAGHALRIIGDDGAVAAEGEVGSIEVRGPTMTSGYLGNKEEPPFTPDGWLRTGDMGLLRDGLLTVMGRAKEQIGVNGRKYSCLEVEQAIIARSRFTQLYVTPLPGASGGDPSAGKPVAVFVVVDESERLADVAGEIRAALAFGFRFAPQIVGILRESEIPRTPLGKVRRLALAELVDDPNFVDRIDRLSARSVEARQELAGATEREVAAVWAKLLRYEGSIPRDANFYVLGGDSVLALQMCMELETRFGCSVPIEQFAETSVLGDFVQYLTLHAHERHAAPVEDNSELSPDRVERLHAFLADWPGEPVVEGGFLRRVGTAREGIPIFWCLQHKGEAEKLGATSGSRRPAYAMRSAHKLARYGTPQAEALSARYAAEIEAAHPTGPLVIAGNCQGCNISLSIVRQLLARGREVRLFAAVDANFAGLFDGNSLDVPVALHIANRSRLNPYRRFRDPGAGLRKLFPAGLRVSRISAAYPIGRRLHVACDDVEQSIAWAQDVVRPKPLEGASWYPDSICAGRISGPPSPMNMYPGERITIAVELLNVSPLPWLLYEESGIALGNHWLKTSGEVVTWADGRTPLDRKVPPGGNHKTRIKIVAPSRPGRYLLELDMVEEGVRWFGEKQKHRPRHIKVIVRPDAAHYLRRLLAKLRAIPASLQGRR